MANDEEELAKMVAEPGAAPGVLHHETPVNGGPSKSAAEPEMAATQLPEVELSVTAPPEAQSPGESQFSMESRAPEVPTPETRPEPVDPSPGVRRHRVGRGTNKAAIALFPRLPRPLSPAVWASVEQWLRYFGGPDRRLPRRAHRRVERAIDAIEGKEGAASAASRGLSAMETRVAAAKRRGQSRNCNARRRMRKGHPMRGGGGARPAPGPRRVTDLDPSKRDRNPRGVCRLNRHSPRRRRISARNKIARMLRPEKAPAPKRSRLSPRAYCESWIAADNFRANSRRSKTSASPRRRSRCCARPLNQPLRANGN
jgi:hypothetical protein